MVEGTFVVQILFVVVSLPVVWFDARDLDIPLVWLMVFLGSAILGGAIVDVSNWSTSALAASTILISGILFLRIFPDRFGEGDILYMAGFPFVFDFFSTLFAWGLACVAGMVFFSWRVLVSRTWTEDPVPFTPFLLWGAVMQFLVKGLVP